MKYEESHGSTTFKTILILSKIQAWTVFPLPPPNVQRVPHSQSTNYCTGESQPPTPSFPPTVEVGLAAVQGSAPPRRQPDSSHTGCVAARSEEALMITTEAEPGTHRTERPTQKPGRSRGNGGENEFLCFSDVMLAAV